MGRLVAGDATAAGPFLHRSHGGTDRPSDTGKESRPGHFTAADH